jgi:hypothetical protein
VQILPPEAVTQWHEKNLEIVRQTTWELESCGTRQIGCLEDGIYSPEDKKLRKITDYVEVADPLAAALKDISLGGAGIILAHEFQEEQWKEKIVLVNFRLPQSEATPAETYSEIEVLATVRGINTVPPYTLLHLRFLQQLPNSLALSHITQKDKTTHNLSWYFMRKEQSDTKFL